MLGQIHQQAPDSREAKVSSRRMLTKALELARDAVALDESEESPQLARDTYARSIELLRDVLENVREGVASTSSTKLGRKRPTKEEELAKLQLIHDTYAKRMQFLDDAMSASDSSPSTPPPPEPLISYIVEDLTDPDRFDERELNSFGTAGSSSKHTILHPYAITAPQASPASSPRRTPITRTLPFSGQFVAPRIAPRPPSSFVQPGQQQQLTRTASDIRRSPSTTRTSPPSLIRVASRSRSHTDLNAPSRPPPTAFAGVRSHPPPQLTRPLTETMLLSGTWGSTSNPGSVSHVGRSRSVSQPTRYSTLSRVVSQRINITVDPPESRVTTTPDMAPMPPPAPPEALRKPYYTMHLLRMSMTCTEGGYLTRRLYIPHAVWSQPGAKLTNLTDKVRVVEVLWSAMDDLHQASFECFGIGNVSAWSNDGMTSKRAGTKEGAAWLVKLEEFSRLCDALVVDFGKKLGVGEGFVFKKSTGMNSLGSKFARRLDKLTNGKTTDSPTTYTSELAKLFAHTQLFDAHIRALLSNPVAPSYAGMPLEMRDAVKLKLQRSSDFYASVVLMFVVRDLSRLLEKYAKECEKWLVVWNESSSG